MKKKNYHINFEGELPLKIRAAVHNVFENFTLFLQYNEVDIPFYEFSVGLEEHNLFSISETFVNNLLNQEFNQLNWFETAPLLRANNKPDYIGTCFYMINCLQEYAPNQQDFLGRFDEEKSYQKRFNCFEKNLVLDYFQEMSSLIFGHKIALKPSKVMLSHDIDFIHAGWKQQLMQALKKLHFSKVAKTIIDKLNKKDPWQNIEQIIQLESKHQISSTFFWIPIKGKTVFTKIANADYSMDETYLKEAIESIEKSHLHNNALHKSISSNSIEKELTAFPDCQKMRYHYLKFNVKDDYPLIEKSSIMEEHSLGFSKHLGFRNSWGLPFTPMNPMNMEQYSFKVFPIHVMDSALYYFMQKHPSEEMIDAAIEFINQHNFSCVLSVLWHNNFVDNTTYQKLLSKIKS